MAQEEPAGKKQPTEKAASSGKKAGTLRKVVLWILGILFSLILIIFIGSFFLDGPLRNMMENKMNSHLKGYTVKIPSLHFQLIGLEMTVKGLTIMQQAHPKPPVAEFALIKGSIHWGALLSARLVGDLRFDHPRLNIDLPQLKAEAESKTPVKERGWQKVFEDLYPLEIDHLAINDGAITYIDKDPDRPLRLSRLNVQVENIRNIHSPEHVYPSTLYLDADIFGTGHGRIEGNANFLAEPFPGVNANFDLKHVPLDYFRPVAAHFNLMIKEGELDGTGTVEYAPKVKKAHVKELAIKGVDIEYIHSKTTAAKEKKRAGKVGKAAAKTSNKPGLLLKLDKFELTGSTVGMINKGADPTYRVYMSDVNLRVTNLSNHFTEGTAEARLEGKFMGSGATTATADFRPEKNGPDFDLDVKIKRAQLKAMNDLLRAYGKFDVKKGYFTLFTEMHVKNGAISGYIKPLFGDIKVYDKRTDKEKSLFHKLYEMLVGGVARLLENRPRKEVATVANISGPVKNPKTSTIQVILELIKNAFFKAILPGFEQEVTRGNR